MAIMKITCFLIPDSAWWAETKRLAGLHLFRLMNNPFLGSQVNIWYPFNMPQLPFSEPVTSSSCIELKHFKVTIMYLLKGGLCCSTEDK